MRVLPLRAGHAPQNLMHDIERCPELDFIRVKQFRNGVDGALLVEAEEQELFSHHLLELGHGHLFGGWAR